MKHRTFSMILAALLAAGTLTSCGGDAPAGSSDTTAADATSAVPETTRDTLDPTLDFGGETVVIYCPNDLSIVEFNAEQTGDVVNDAVYKRNIDVQERLNVNFEWVESVGLWANEQGWKGTLRTSITAGDAVYDLVAGYGVFVAQLAAEQLFCDLSSTAHIDFAQPWWSDTLDNLRINGKLFFASGDISTNTIGTTFAAFFHKGLLGDYKLENPYELVDTGKWTMDKMFGMTKDIYKDLNGNEKRDQTDFYGLHAQFTSFDNLYFSAGMHVVEPDKENGMVISKDFGSEKMATLVEKLCNAFNHTDGIHWGEEENKEVVKNFMNENAIFLLSGMSVASTNLRDVNFEYGIVPTPKWDEAQENYMCTSAYTGALWSIPIDAKNADMSSAVMEAFAIEGYYEVAPAFFETALKVKYSSDDDSARMYDIIRQARSYDFGRVYSTAGLDGIPGKLRGMVTSDNINWMSTYESNITQFETRLAELVEKLGG